MSESSPADATPDKDAADAVPPPAKTDSGPAQPDSGSTQKVSEKAQEDAANDRAESGGYT